MTDAPDPIAQPEGITPLRMEFDELGGYDCTCAAYVIFDRTDHQLFTVDVGRYLAPTDHQGAYRPHPQAEADATYIVEACNAYPGLVLALREARQQREFEIAAIKELHATPGKFEAFMEGEGLTLFAAMAACMVREKGGPNYVEFIAADRKHDGRRYAIEVRVLDGITKSSHTLRKEAEAERDALKAQLDEARRLLNPPTQSGQYPAGESHP